MKYQDFLHQITLNMVKCAAYNCRSGYKPTNSEKEILKSGGSIPFRRSVFSFPNKMHHKEVRDKWIRALKLKENNWNPDNFGVCELHFRKEDFFDQDTTWRKTGRKRNMLKRAAIPSTYNYRKQ